MINIATIYSESHKELFDIFRDSIFEYKNVNLISKELPLKNPLNGKYGTQEFREACLEKIKMIVDILTGEMIRDGEYFVYSDADIKYFSNPEPIVHNIINTFPKCDLVCQRDWNGPCTGWMIIKKNKTNIAFFSYLLSYIESNLLREGDFHDQIAFHEVFFNENKIVKPRIVLVDHNSGISNLNHIKPGILWEEGQEIVLTHEPICWHANFTVGVNNKIKMMNYVTNLVEKLRAGTN